MRATTVDFASFEEKKMKLNHLKIEIKWAIVFVVFTLFWLTMEKMLGYHDEKIAQHPIVTNLILFPAIAIYTLAFLDKRKNFYHGAMSFKQGFKIGFTIAVIVSLLMPISQSIIQLVISPDYFANAIAYSVESGNATYEEASSFFTLGSYIVQGMIGNLIIGSITSLILALILQKKE